MDAAVKVTERRIRRALERRGMDLQRCRARDPSAAGFGLYRICTAARVSLSGDGYRLTLDEAEQWCERTKPRRIEKRAEVVAGATVRLLQGDALSRLKPFPDGRFRCCVTSPPYFGLRDYAVKQQIGLEPTLPEYIGKLVKAFREVRRVLADDGTLWLNINDSYSAGGGYGPEAIGDRAQSRQNRKHPDAYIGRRTTPGFAPKNLLGVPWRVALALQDDGWFLRSEIIWHKPNANVENVKDRPTRAHEQVFLLSKSQFYFFDGNAISEAVSPTMARRLRASNGSAAVAGGAAAASANSLSRNARTIWSIPVVAALNGDHPATMPQALAERCIRAGSRVGDEVLDPFAGSGTTAMAAAALGRAATLVELSPKYVAVARERLGAMLR
jgi:DNA modification methylase